MRLRADIWLHGNATPMDYEASRLRLPRSHCCGFHNFRLEDGVQRPNLVLDWPVSITATGR